MKLSFPLFLLLAASSASAFTSQPKKVLLTFPRGRGLNYNASPERQPLPEAMSPRNSVWDVLIKTEQWLKGTLKEPSSDNNNSAAPPAKPQHQGTPLSRKEIAYVCETSEDSAMILANIFRKIKEVRELGERHGQQQEALSDQQGGE
jgi:hypothetical protein